MSTNKGWKTKNVDIIDKAILRYFCEPVAPLFRATGHTANSISVYGLFFTIGSLYYLAQDHMIRFTIYFWIAYLFDCLDGYYARKYNMVTELGDLFEHVRDLISLVLTALICCLQYVVTQRIMFLTVLANLATGLHVACTQKNHVDRDYVETLDLLQILCFDNNISSMAPHYGVGFYMVTVNVVIVYLSKGLGFLIKCCILASMIIYFYGYYHANYQNRKMKTSGSKYGTEVISIPKESFSKEAHSIETS